MSDVDSGQPAVTNIRSNYLPGFYLGSIVWPSGTYHQTRQFSVLVLERAIIFNNSGARAGVCALRWGDGSGPLTSIVVAPTAGDPFTYVYPLNVSVPFGGTIDFPVFSGDFGVALSAYWTPHYDNP